MEIYVRERLLSFSALVHLQSGKWANKVAELIIQSEDLQAAINFIKFALRREPLLHQKAQKIFIDILSAELEKSKGNGPSHKWRKISLALLDYLEFYGERPESSMLPQIYDCFRKAKTSKNLLTIAYFSILLLLEEDDLDEEIFKFHLQRHQGDSTILCKIIRKFPSQSLLFFPKLLHLQDSAILSALIRFTALSEKQLSGVFELFENQILTNRQGRVSSAQLEVAFLLARRSVKNEERVRRLLKSETTKEQFQLFQKNLDESD
ncbi:Oidioi.mRNA.OKI2018_I69.chr1.g1559.t1.cds [Oikopleura dioica]|uniref:Oidioi.mRNA.OKI2018_I69.chr1.g1559.t1.cds n=1 Tax=Oikopleura dioica TaxID=34765 RepID=A0ABN7SSI9_OIKDI|nr:Oidioi.mRNA.OKI2018_I69.chr1.g1559.t1.cds [Oikopleura dioica]